MAAEPMDLQAPVAAPLTADRDFDVLYREHFDRLRRFCLGLTGQESLAEDIAQETLLRAYIRMAQFDLSRPMWPWLKRVATRLVIDNARAASREVLDGNHPEGVSRDNAEVAAERQLLDAALGALPARQRMAVALRYVDDWKPAEVAELLGLNKGAVEQLLHRARRRLCSEYRRLSGEAPTKLRVALWPLVLLFGRVRDRAARIRQVVNDGGTSLALATDATTHVVVAVAIAGVLAGGVAAAETAPPRPAAVKDAVAVSAEKATAEKVTSTETRVESPAPRQRATVDPSTAAVKEVAPAPAQEPVETTSTTSVEVNASQAPIDDAPAKPEARATKTRSADAANLSGTVRGHVAEKAPGTDAIVSIDCDGGAVWRTACAATDDGDETLQESAP